MLGCANFTALVYYTGTKHYTPFNEFCLHLEGFHKNQKRPCTLSFRLTHDPKGDYFQTMAEGVRKLLYAQKEYYDVSQETNEYILDFETPCAIPKRETRHTITPYVSHGTKSGVSINTTSKVSYETPYDEYEHT